VHFADLNSDMVTCSFFLSKMKATVTMIVRVKLNDTECRMGSKNIASVGNK